MRRFMSVLCVAVVTLVNVGCFLPSYSSNPNRRMKQMLVQSENLRQVEDEFERFFFLDQPSHLTYDRIHGGIE